ncbi:MAG: sugar ABC transporter permease [Anaerolineales bacterium]
MAAMTQTVSPEISKKPGRGKTTPNQRREIRWGLFFLSPWFIGVTVFTAIPILASLFFSFTNYDPTAPQNLKFIGLANYAYMFVDPGVIKAIQVTLLYVLYSVPLALIIPLLAAVLVNAKYLFGKNLVRALFYMPSMIPVVVSVMIWQGVFNTNTGWLNIFIKQIFNLQGPSWLQDEALVIPVIVVMGIWGIGGPMITMLAGLQNVPTELYESATIDGANGVQKFAYITVPMISPIIFYNLIIAVIGAFQVMIPGYILGNGRGDPNGATMFYNLYLYMSGWTYHNMGYAATLAWVMFIVVLVLTILLFWGQKRWVYYAGGA